MKYLSSDDLHLLVKMVNEQDNAIAHAADLAAVVRRQDRAYKALPAESIEDGEKAVAPVEEIRRRLKVIRSRLIAELQS